MNVIQPMVLSISLVVLAAPAPARAEETAPVVHVEASPDVVLERVDATGTTPVCHAPCDRELAADEYQLSGDGIRTSNRFRIPESTPVKVDVKPRSSGGFTTGVVLTTLSGVFLAGGIALFAGGWAMGTENGLAADFFMFPGAMASLATSLGLGIPGIYLLVTNLQSRARVLEGDMRAVSQAQPPPPRTFAVPVFSQSF